MDTRPVWLTRNQIDALKWSHESHLITTIVAAWDAAPADATEAVSTALWESLHDFPGKGVAFDRSLDAVLRALGMPCHD